MVRVLGYNSFQALTAPGGSPAQHHWPPCFIAQAGEQLCTGSQEVGHKFLGYLDTGRTELICQLFKEVMGPARWPAPQNQASPLSRERWSFSLALPLAHTVSLGFLCVARFH